jgi:hypothetical protein
VSSVLRRSSSPMRSAPRGLSPNAGSLMVQSGGGHSARSPRGRAALFAARSPDQPAWVGPGQMSQAVGRQSDQREQADGRAHHPPARTPGRSAESVVPGDRQARLRQVSAARPRTLRTTRSTSGSSTTTIRNHSALGHQPPIARLNERNQTLMGLTPRQATAAFPSFAKLRTWPGCHEVLPL